MENCGKGFFTPAASVQNDEKEVAQYGAPPGFRYPRMLLNGINEEATEKIIEGKRRRKGI